MVGTGLRRKLNDYCCDVYLVKLMTVAGAGIL